jgi:hypothetical protein
VCRAEDSIDCSAFLNMSANSQTIRLASRGSALDSVSLFVPTRIDMKALAQTDSAMAKSDLS